MEPPSQAIYEFGPFRLDPAQHVFLQDGRAVPLPPKAFEILTVLVENRGTLVSKTDLQERVWPDTFVDENNLAQHISLLRKLLGETHENPRYIETVSRVGYRFIAETRVAANGRNGGGVLAPEAGGFPAAEPSAGIHAPSVPDAERDEGSQQFAAGKHLPRGRMFAILAIAALTFAALLGFWYWPTPIPAVLDSVQLTHDGYAKRGPVFTDGESVYFTEIRNGEETLVRVPRKGGEPIPLFGTTTGMSPVDFSSRRHEILALGDAGAEGTVADHTLWACALPSGPFRRVGDLMASSAAWSPDGSQISFSKDKNLWVAKSDGSDPRQLLAVPGRVVWLRSSPDGRFLRFHLQHERGAGDELWEARADGSHLRQISLGGSAEAEVSMGTWTHSGRYFLFGESNHGKESLWTLREATLPFLHETRARLNTGLLTISTVGAAPEGDRVYAIGKLDRAEMLRYDVKSGALTPYLAGASGDGLAFSRDGAWVAYTSYPERALVRSRVNGSERRELTEGNRKALLPAWSPDGKRIAYMERTQAGPWKIHLVASDGGTPEELLPGTEDEGNPAWSPDGNSLIFAGVPWEHGFSPQSTAIHQADLHSRQVVTLPDSAGLWSPRWSPDGKHLVAETSDSRSLVLYDFAAKRWMPLASAKDAVIGYTSWSHDSHYIYYNTYAGQRGMIYRADLLRHAIERVSIGDGISAGVTLGQWFTLAPDDSPLVLRDASVRELFALDLRLP